VNYVLKNNPERFASRTGAAAKAVGRHSNATVWSVTQAPSHAELHDSPGGSDGRCDSSDFPYRESDSPESLPLPGRETDSDPESQEA
jgi:hypothetical protein